MIRSVRSFDGTKIVYKIKKNKPTFVLLLHGLGTSSSIWDREAQLLHDLGFSVIIPDLRGHGKSDKPPDKHSYYLENLAKDIDYILTKENIKKIVLIGHSLGGVISVLYYKFFREKVDSIVLVNTDYKMPVKLYLLYKIRHFLKRANKSSIYCLEQTKEYSKKFKKENVELLSKIKVPVLFIEGTKDPVIPPKHMEAMCEFIKNAEFHSIIGAHHNILIEKADEVNKYIFDFFRRHLHTNLRFPRIMFPHKRQFIYERLGIRQITFFSLIGLAIAILSTPQIFSFTLISMNQITGANVLSIPPSTLHFSLFARFIFNFIFATVLIVILYKLLKKS